MGSRQFILFQIVPWLLLCSAPLSLDFYDIFVLFWDRGFYITRWLQICYVAKDGLEFLILLLVPFKCWDCRYSWPCLFIWCWGIEVGQWMPDKYSTSWVTSLAPLCDTWILFCKICPQPVLELLLLRQKKSSVKQKDLFWLTILEVSVPDHWLYVFKPGLRQLYIMVEGC